MYVFMISGLCLLMFVIYYVYTTVYRKGGQSTRKAPVETGTQGKDEVDMDWIPDMVKSKLYKSCDGHVMSTKTPSYYARI